MKDNLVQMLKLIGLIKKRKVLWNRVQYKPNNKGLKRKMWEEVATKMKCPLPIVKKKWKSLRDVFRRELKKIKETQNQSKQYKSEWRYFDAMLFINKELPQRGLQNVENFQEDADNDSNALQPKQIVITRIESIDIFTNQEKHQPEETQVKFEPLCSSHKDDEAAAPSDAGEPETGRRQVGEIQDEDYYFAMSLLPYMRRVPASRKLKMRITLIQVLQDES